MTDYVGWGTQDLLWMVDGIRNVGVTSDHDNSSTRWVDLCGSGKDITGVNNFVGASWADDGLNTQYQNEQNINTGNLFYYNTFFHDDSYFQGGATFQSLFQFHEVVDGKSAAHNLMLITTNNSNMGTIWINGAWGTSLGGGYNYWTRQQIIMSSLLVGKFYHVTSTYEIATRKMIEYLNGVKVYEGTASSDLSLHGGYMLFNYNPWSNVGGITGRHYVHRFYGRLLTDSEVAYNFNIDKERYGIV